MHSQSKYNFQHDYKVMEIGADVTVNGQTLCARRIKGTKDTLRSADNTIISELRLDNMLNGISHDSYEQIYSLDDDSLEAGGESILNSNGDLGALLFSVMSGLSDITDTLTQTQQITERFLQAKWPNSAIKYT